MFIITQFKSRFKGDNNIIVCGLVTVDEVINLQIRGLQGRFEIGTLRGKPTWISSEIKTIVRQFTQQPIAPDIPWVTSSLEITEAAEKYAPRGIVHTINNKEYINAITTITTHQIWRLKREQLEDLVTAKLKSLRAISRMQLRK